MSPKFVRLCGSRGFRESHPAALGFAASAARLRGSDSAHLVFYCTLCQRVIGYLQGDSWTAEKMDADAEGTRWSHLEMGESKPEKLKVGDFDLED